MTSEREPVPIATTPVAPPTLSPPLAPPTVAGELRLPLQNPKWPTAIGIVGIVLGAIMAMNGLWQFVTPWYFRFISAFGAQAPGAKNMFQALTHSTWYYYTAGSVLVILAAWLIAASVGVLRRRPAGATALSAWGWCGCIGALALSIGTGWMQHEMMTAMQQGMPTNAPGGPPPGVFAGVSIVTAAITVIFTLLFTMAYPVFVLIWMNRASVKAHVQTWSLPSVSAHARTD